MKVKKLNGVPANTIIKISRIHGLSRCQKGSFYISEVQEINLEEKRNLGAKTVKGQQEEEHKGMRISDLHTSILIHG